ncbi:amidase [Castellaniella sp.]|uniref:amidase n=1 Tax=Castellaniella sp. TaxID=1955812 RepID=UPI003A8CE062
MNDQPKDIDTSLDVEAIVRVGISGLAERIRTKSWTCRQVADHFSQRIDSSEAVIQAWAWFDGDRMQSLADDLDAALREGKMMGPLCGVPIGVKDVISTEGVPTGMGSPIFKGYIPSESAVCVKRLELAGAYVAGKTVTTEFATQYPGPTRNPWAVSHTPGGSSSGSAAAVAAGFVPAALATQTRGSTIRPAAYCGVVGFKPSYGLISRTGVKAVSPSLDHVGVITKSVRDAGMLVSVLMGPDPQDVATIGHYEDPKEFRSARQLERPPRIAVLGSMPWADASGEQSEALAGVLRRAQAHGCVADAVALPPSFGQAHEAARIIQLFELAENFRELLTTDGEKMSPLFRGLIERGDSIPRQTYEETLEYRNHLRRELSKLMSDFDAVVSHPAAGEAPETLLSTGDSAFNSLWTFCGVPAITLPVGISSHGLPLGIQLIADYSRDVVLLKVAQWFEVHCPFSFSPKEAS